MGKVITSLNKECVDGGLEHKDCEEVDYDGDKLVVCHKCKQTLGRKCEIYSRVVGYLRPIDGWNKGKKEEFNIRKTYKV